MDVALQYIVSGGLDLYEDNPLESMDNLMEDDASTDHDEDTSYGVKSVEWNEMVSIIPSCRRYDAYDSDYEGNVPPMPIQLRRQRTRRPTPWIAARFAIRQRTRNNNCNDVDSAERDAQIAALAAVFICTPDKLSHMLKNLARMLEGKKALLNIITVAGVYFQRFLDQYDHMHRGLAHLHLSQNDVDKIAHLVEVVQDRRFEDILLACFVLAVKYHEDEHHANNVFAEVNGFVSLIELNRLELEIFWCLGFNVFVTPSVFAERHQKLVDLLFFTRFMGNDSLNN